MPSRLLAAALVAHPASPPVLPPPQPCITANIALDELEAAVQQAARPAPPRQPEQPRRWSLLLPVRVWLGGHDGIRAALAWTETQSGVDGRWAQYADRAVTVRVEWDLRDLARDPVRPPPLSTQQHLELALKAEQLAGRLAEPLRLLRRAQAQARALLAEDVLCAQAQADAQAAAFVLRSVVGAVQANRGATGSADPGPAARPALPTADPE